MSDAFECSFIQHLVFHHCVECKTYEVECVSNVFIDIQTSIICGVPQKIKTREGHKQDQREEAKMVSKKEKDSNVKTDWTDDEISLLTDMLEAKPCLWDVYRTDYTKRGIKEIAYTETATSLDKNVPSIKTKINCLRAKLGQEVAKEKKQSNDELYYSNWIHYDKLAFLVPVIGASKSRNALKRIDLQEDENEKEVGGTPVAKRKTLAEKKLDLLSKCTEAITANANTKASLPKESATRKMSVFSLYVEEKLSQLDKRDRRIAEKHISDILLEAEMSHGYA